LERWTKIIVISLLLVSLFAAYYQVTAIWPEEILLIQGEEHRFRTRGFFPVEFKVQGQQELLINGKLVNTGYHSVFTDEPISFVAEKTGNLFLEIRAFGFWNLGQMMVNIVPPTKVYPGGEAIGVLVRSRGVKIVGLGEIETLEGRRVAPGEEAGLMEGDRILAIEGELVEGQLDIARGIQNSEGKPLNLLVERNGIKTEIEIVPRKAIDGNYMIGVYINDGVAGVGTLTYFHPETLSYGALGHVLKDNYSQQPLEIEGGEIVKVNISGITRGESGFPGEKYGLFYGDQEILGTIEKNTPFGIFGVLNEPLKNNVLQKPVPVASALQIEKGSAEMYTVISGDEVEKFDVVVEKVFPQIRPAEKGLIVRIEDERLLEKTGGIVQGMSGSPIIQNDRLIGAVTHVFVNDPSRGYAIAAEWMLREGNLSQKFTKNAS